MDDVIRNDLDVCEPLVRRLFHQLELTHANLAVRIAGPAPQRPNGVLEVHLGVPVVGLEKEQLATGLQKAMQRFEVLAVRVVAQDGRPYDVVEALGWKRSEIADMHDSRIGQVPLSGRTSQVLVEDRRRDWILAAERGCKVLGP